MNRSTIKVSETFSDLRSLCWVFILYLIFFHVLFLQFPLQSALPGNTDTWVGIVGVDYFFYELFHFISGSTTGQVMYPTESVLQFGELPMGNILLAVPTRFLGRSDVVGHYLYLSLTFTMTAFAVYKLVLEYVENRYAAFFSGFAFMTTSYTWAIIDNPHLTFLFFSVMSLVHYKRYMKSFRRRNLVLMGVYGGLQIYFAVYPYFYLAVMLLIGLLVNLRKIIENRRYIDVAIAIAIFFSVAMPLFLFYYLSPMNAQYKGLESNFLHHANHFSMRAEQLFCVLEGNLLYPKLCSCVDRPECNLLMRNWAFIGFGLYILAAIGLWRAKKNGIELVAMIVVGLLLALGPIIHIGSFEFTSPVMWLYNNVPLITHIRYPARAILISFLAISILAAYGLSYILSRIPSDRAIASIAVVAMAMVFHCCENIPVPMKAYGVEQYLDTPEGYGKYFKNESPLVLLELPSNLKFNLENDFRNSDKSLYEIPRELLYLYYVTKHKQHIVNGAPTFYPKTRMALQKHIDGLPKVDAFYELMEREVQYIVWHKDMLLPTDDLTLDQLRQKTFLLEEYDDDRITIFKIDEEALTLAYDHAKQHGWDKKRPPAIKINLPGQDR